MTLNRPAAVAFDLGGVLIDWNPRHLYRQLFDDGAEMERFLADVCSPAWNAQLDAGRSFAEAVETLSRVHPAEAGLIEAYRSRWPEMLGASLDETVEIARELKRAGIPVFGLSNWASETFAATRLRYRFLDELDGIVISGEVGVGKPDARIFRHFLARFGLEAATTVFVDDSAANVAAAAALGFLALQFGGAARLRGDLLRLGLPLRVDPEVVAG